MLRGLLTLLALAAVGAAGWWWWTTRPVAAVAVCRTEVARIIAASGYVRQRNTVELRPEHAGRLGSMVKDQGDDVRAGEVMARIVDERPQTAVAQARAAIEVMRSEVEDARIAYERERQLRERKVSSEANYDAARLRYERLQLEVVRLEAELAEAERTLAEFTVTSPIDGTVLERGVDPGNSVDTNTLLFRIADNAAPEIETEIDETLAGRVSLGQEAVLARNGVDERVPAKVSRVAPGVDRGTGGRLIRLEPDSPVAWPPGATVDVNILVEKRPDSLVLPRTSLIENENGAKAARVADGRVRLVTVKVDPWPGEQAVILGGLESGDVVLAEPALAVEGGEVRVEVRPCPSS